MGITAPSQKRVATPNTHSLSTTLLEPTYRLRLGVRSLNWSALNASLGPFTQPKLWSGVGRDRWVKQALSSIPPPDGAVVPARDGTPGVWETVSDVTLSALAVCNSMLGTHPSLSTFACVDMLHLLLTRTQGLWAASVQKEPLIL